MCSHIRMLPIHNHHGSSQNLPVAQISLTNGDYFLDGPIFIKSGVTLSGSYSDDVPTFPFFRLHDGPNTASTTEDAVIVIDGATDAEVSTISSVVTASRTEIHLGETNNREVKSPRSRREGCRLLTGAIRLAISDFDLGTFHPCFDVAVDPSCKYVSSVGVSKPCRF